MRFTNFGTARCYPLEPERAVGVAALEPTKVRAREDQCGAISSLLGDTRAAISAPSGSTGNAGAPTTARRKRPASCGRPPSSSTRRRSARG